MYSSSLEAGVNLILVAIRLLCLEFVMHISRCLLMRGLVRSYHQEWGGRGGGEKERLATAPAKLSCYYAANSKLYCHHTAINKNHENICPIFATTEHEFSAVSIAETWKRWMGLTDN